ncbi:MAG: hypothetical protein RMK29_12610 [Myxococcales bacterium]|nr:hypothetical protein [Myxococcota bacterium]MDW8282546.1 hypothetical protein [Myxococcales bacterium]
MRGQPLRAAWAGVLTLVLACEHAPPLPEGPRVVAVDLIDAQDQVDGQPARRRLYGPAALPSVPEGGPELSLRIYLSAPLDSRSLPQAEMQGVLVREVEGTPVRLRSFAAGEPEPGGVLAAQVLTIVPDVRSGRDYLLVLDHGFLQTEAGQRFEVPPPLRFRTARRFVVLRAEPPDGAQVPLVSLIRLWLSSVAHERPSRAYGVTVTSGGVQQEVDARLSANRRQLLVEPLCPLPPGDTVVVVPRDGIEEDETFAPLEAAWHQRITITEDAGPCSNTPDMR